MKRKLTFLRNEELHLHITEVLLIITMSFFFKNLEARKQYSFSIYLTVCFITRMFQFKIVEF